MSIISSIKKVFTPAGKSSTKTFNASNQEISVPFSSALYGANKSVISEQQLLVLSDFMSILDLVADTFAKLEFNYADVKVVNGFKYQTIKHDSNYDYLLNHKPNELQNAYSFKKSIIYNIFIKKVFYAWVYKLNDVPVEIIPLESNRVSIVKNKYGETSYLYDLGAGKEPTPIPEEDMLVMDWNTVQGFQDLSFEKTHQVVLQMLSAMDKIDINVTSNTNVITGVIKVPDKATKEQKADIKAQFQELSTSQGSGVLVMDPLWTYEPLSDIDQKSRVISPEYRKDMFKKMARIFRVPIAKLGYEEDGAKAYKSTNEMELQFITNAIVPWADQFLAMLNWKFVSNPTKRAFIYDLFPLIKHDYGQIADIGVKLASNGIATPNEIRTKFLKWPPVPGGDNLMVNSATQPLDLIAENLKVQIEAQKKGGGNA